MIKNLFNKMFSNHQENTDNTSMTVGEYEELKGLLKPGAKIRMDWDVMSRIVNITTDGDTNIVVYKDWVKHKKRYYYHCNTLENVAFNIHLYDKEGLKGPKTPKRIVELSNKLVKTYFG